MAQALRRRIERSAPQHVMAVAVFLVTVVASIDVVTGPLLSFSFFYVIPISLVAWRFALAPTISAAVVAAMVWFAIDVLTGPGRPLAIPVWNALIRTGFFLTIAILLGFLRDALAHEGELARIDMLTGLLNRRAFEEIATIALARSARHGDAVTVALLDLDDFKSINDACGHASGDAALVAVAESLEASVRGADVAARLGGDEFALLIEGDERAADVVLGRVVEGVGRLVISGRRLSCSIGAASARAGSLPEVLAEADRALYAAKQRGKNRYAFGSGAGSAGANRAQPEPAITHGATSTRRTERLAT